MQLKINFQGKKPTGVFGTYLDLVAKKVPVNRRRELLDSNAPISKFLINENEVRPIEVYFAKYTLLQPQLLCSIGAWRAVIVCSTHEAYLDRCYESWRKACAMAYMDRVLTVNHGT